MSCEAEILTLCSYCKYMACFLNATVPEGIPSLVLDAVHVPACIIVFGWLSSSLDHSEV